MAVALALDLGGTKVESALIDSEGLILPGSRARRPTGRDSTTEDLEDAVKAVLSESLNSIQTVGIEGAGIEGAGMEGFGIKGIGIGAAGPINLESESVSPLNLPAWRDFPLIELVRSLVGELPVAMQMDGLCITLAETWKGAARGLNNVLGMVVSTGIGGGLVIGGVPAPGASGNAGHIGHIQVAGFGDPECSCGGRACLEAIASGPSSVRWAKSQGWRGDTGEQLAIDAQSGNELAIRAIERSGRAIGLAIGSASCLIDLDAVVIGGGFSKVGTLMFDAIRRGLDEHDGFAFSSRLQLLEAALGDSAPLIGAAALVHLPNLRAEP